MDIIFFAFVAAVAVMMAVFFGRFVLLLMALLAIALGLPLFGAATSWPITPMIGLGICLAAMAVAGCMTVLHDEVLMRRWRAMRVALVDAAVSGEEFPRSSLQGLPHFAWLPVRTDCGWAWLRLVDKRLAGFGSTSETDFYSWVFREIGR